MDFLEPEHINRATKPRESLVVDQFEFREFTKNRELQPRVSSGVARKDFCLADVLHCRFPGRPDVDNVKASAQPKCEEVHRAKSSEYFAQKRRCPGDGRNHEGG